jgi:NDP-sugar pyrophosphorylase family protein
MKAVIFAAGFGTRLKPLTNEKPKALIKIHGHTLLELAIRQFQKFNINQFVINIHHFADQVAEYLNSHNNFGAEIILSDERQKLLDTGGGLIKMQKYLSDDDFLIMNVDILSSIDFTALMNFHRQSNSLATLAIRNRTTSRYLLFDDHFKLRGWKNKKTGEALYTSPLKNDLKAFAFSGIHAVSPEIFKYAPQQEVFSIVNWYLDLAKNHKLSGFLHNRDEWLDVGKLPVLEKAEKYIKHTHLL